MVDEDFEEKITAKTPLFSAGDVVSNYHIESLISNRRYTDVYRSNR